MGRTPSRRSPVEFDARVGRLFFLFFFTLVTGPRRSLNLRLSDARVYEHQIRARLGTTARQTILRLTCWVFGMNTSTLTRKRVWAVWGYNPVCKVTPVILHGAPCRMTGVTLHGVASPEAHTIGDPRKTELGRALSRTTRTRCVIQASLSGTNINHDMLGVREL